MSSDTLDFIDCDGVGACVAGATFDKTLTWKIDGTPVDLTGASARMQVRLRPTTDVIIELSSLNSRIVLGGTAGTIQLLIDAADTAELAVGRYVYDLMVTIGSKVERLIAGKFDVVPSVTHDD